MPENNPILSIIVPSYNTARFFSNYAFYEDPNLGDKIEVLFIDDGSKDNTKEVAQDFCKKNPKRFRLLSKENGGHGSTINFGIQFAKGKYFRAIDGDDDVDPEALTALVSELERLDVDAIITDFRNAYSDPKKNEIVHCGHTPGVVMRNTGLENCFLKFHAMIYKTDMWREANIQLTEKVFYEDQEYVLFPLAHIGMWIYLPIVAYNYNLGIPGQSISPESFRRHFDDHEKVANSIISYCRRELPNPTCLNKEAIVSYASTCLGLHLEMIALVAEGKGLRRKLLEFYHSFDDLHMIQKKAKKACKTVRILSICNFAFAKLYQPLLRKMRGF